MNDDLIPLRVDAKKVNFIPVKFGPDGGCVDGVIGSQYRRRNLLKIDDGFLQWVEFTPKFGDVNLSTNFLGRLLHPESRAPYTAGKKSQEVRMAKGISGDVLAYQYVYNGAKLRELK
jgi:hypothetical protein